MCNSKEYKLLRRISKQDSPLSDYSYSLFLFISRLVSKSTSDEITDLFFLSREGKYLKQLYDNYILENNITNCPQSHYLYVSRKAVINSTLSDIDNEKFDSLKTYDRLSILKFLDVFEFSEDKKEKMLNEIKCDVNVEYFNFFDSSAFDELKHNTLFREQYEARRTIENNNFLKYLKNSGFLDSKRVALVDVGWNGTMQNHLYKLGFHKELYGYYIGARTSLERHSGNKKCGLLFEVGSRHVFSHYCHNYEYLCVADHGGVVGYDSDGNPVLKDDYDVNLYDCVFCDVQKRIMDKFRTICKELHGKETLEKSLEKCIVFRHTKMLSNFSKTEKKILQYAISRHPDNLVDIKNKKNLKYHLFKIRRQICIRLQLLSSFFAILRSST